MDILYICSDFGIPIFGFKGASIHVREMVRALSRDGHRVTVVSPAISGQPGEELASATFHPLPASSHHIDFGEEIKSLDTFFGSKLRIRQEVRNLLYNTTLYSFLETTLVEKRFDFVYERYTLFSYAGIKFARERAIPHLLEINAPLAYEQEKMRGLEMRALAHSLETRIFRETDLALPVSKTLARLLHSCEVADERILVLPNSVDPDRFQPGQKAGARIRRKLGLNRECVIGFVGSLKPWHGTETLVQAFARLKRRDAAHLMIVGDGPGRQQLEELARASHIGSRVTFTGKVAYRDIPAYIDAMDIAAAPYTPNENFYYSPIKIFEYMAMQKPVVAGRIGQVEEAIMHGRNGLLFEPGNTSDLAATLDALVDDSEQRHRLGESARHWVMRERTWQNNARTVIRNATKRITTMQEQSKGMANAQKTQLV